jgi:hypothetical protein
VQHSALWPVRRAGAFTAPEQVDYGVPVWRQPIITDRFASDDDNPETPAPEPRPLHQQ